jgi:hypothetical protein
VVRRRNREPSARGAEQDPGDGAIRADGFHRERTPYRRPASRA